MDLGLASSHWSSASAVAEKTPSGVDGIEPVLENAYRFRTAWFIEELGKALLW